MDSAHLAAPKHPPEINIPESVSTFDVGIIETYTVYRYLQSPGKAYVNC